MRLHHELRVSGEHRPRNRRQPGQHPAATLVRGIPSVARFKLGGLAGVVCAGARSAVLPPIGFAAAWGCVARIPGRCEMWYINGVGRGASGNNKHAVGLGTQHTNSTRRRERNTRRANKR